MPRDEDLLFADHMGRYYAKNHGFPPMAGRLLGYLLVCDPPWQTIDGLGDALMASRSAITGAVKLLEGYGYVRRTRRAGERVDRVGLRSEALEPRNFEPMFKEQAALLREGLALLPETRSAQRAALEEFRPRRLLPRAASPTGARMARAPGRAAYRRQTDRPRRPAPLTHPPHRPAPGTGRCGQVWSTAPAKRGTGCHPAPNRPPSW
jgi:hypothetical protein